MALEEVASVVSACVPQTCVHTQMQSGILIFSPSHQALPLWHTSSTCHKNIPFTTTALSASWARMSVGRLPLPCPYVTHFECSPLCIFFLCSLARTVVSPPFTLSLASPQHGLLPCPGMHLLLRATRSTPSPFLNIQ